MRWLRSLTAQLSAWLPAVSRQQLSEFRAYRFFHNTVRILILSLILFLEQLIYAVLVSRPGSIHQTIYYLTAFAMGCFAAAAFSFYRRRPRRMHYGHTLFELSLGAFGLAVALLRVLVIETEVFRIPTIYIAVLYGLAVIFYFDYRQSFVLYTAVSVAAILLLPSYHPHISNSSYIADISSNGLIAWIISAMNYRFFVHDFLNKKEISRKNEALQETNRQLQEANEELARRSIRDGLTDLYNRRKLEDLLADAYAKARRYGTDFAVIIMDIDHFKHINDTYGHTVGDGILRELGKVLAESIRETDTCGRWGGEEFLILCPETGHRSAVSLAERLRRGIESRQFSGGYTVTASFGVASHAPRHQLKDLLQTADTRLYAAKDAGRNRVRGAGERSTPGE